MIEEYKDSPLGKIPNDWEVLSIDEYADVTKLAGYEFTEYIDYVDDGEIIALRALNAKNGKLVLNDIKRIRKKVSENLLRSKLYIDDIVFTYVGTIGEVAIIRENDKFHLAPNIAKITIREKKNPDYLCQYLRSPIITSEITKLLTTTSQPAMSMGNIRKLKTIFPPLPEQQKIAEILSTVDDKIEVIDQQIIETQELKKGLMQRLLTKGIGHAKFKDSPLGMIPKSWDVVKCDSIADITSSKRVYLSDYTDCGIPFFRGKEITQLAKGEKLNDLVYIKEDTFIEFKNRFGAPKEGDILITAVGTIGSIYMVNSTDNFYFKDGNLMWLREIDSRLNRQFITHYFRSIIFQNLIDIISSGSSQKALTIVKFKLLPVVIPPLNEQIKISEILDSVYEKISVLEDKKTHYQELKQGLMQQLLTGKIRVKL